MNQNQKIAISAFHCTVVACFVVIGIRSGFSVGGIRLGIGSGRSAASCHEQCARHGPKKYWFKHGVTLCSGAKIQSVKRAFFLREFPTAKSCKKCPRSTHLFLSLGE